MSSQESSSIDGIFTQATRWWPKPKGLFAAFILEILLTAVIAGAIGLTAGPFTLLLSGVWLVTAAVWRWARRLRRPAKNRIGLVVAIDCDDDPRILRARDDFIVGLRRNIKDGRLGNRFDFQEAPDHISASIVDREAALRIRARCRCHFLLYGRLREREIGMSVRYVFDLSGAVAHRPLAPVQQQNLVREFSELLPGRVSIDEKIGLLGLEFTSRWADLVAKYIIGLAIALSGFLDEAEEILTAVNDQVTQIKEPLPAYAKIRERTPMLLDAIRVARARHYYREWCNNHREQDLSRASDELESLTELSKNPSVLTLKAILNFLTDQNCPSARALLTQIANTDRDALWNFNVGFLHAYEGNIKQANRHYRTGAKLSLLPEKIAELEEFNSWVLEQEPGNAGVAYARGLLNMNLKGDKRCAIQDFKHFLKNIPLGHYKRDKAAVRGWIARMEGDLEREG